ncbi:hypothetical protein Trydic_g17186 [Trypoxylus dichotomus]
MVFGSGNKFRIRRSQSKASYLASRRDRNRIVPDSDTGSYKRTLSPNGHLISTDVVPQEPPKLTPKDAIWAIKSNKEVVINNNNNNNSSTLRRTSVCDQNKNATIQSQEMKEDMKKNQVILPDVLPINAKLAPRSQYPNRPSNLTLPTHLDDFITPKSPPKSPPSSPPKSPSRNSPYTPLRSTNLSSSPMRTPSLRLSPQTIIPSSPQFISAPMTISSPIRPFPSQKIASPSSPASKVPGFELRPTTLPLQRSSSTESKPSVPSPQRSTPPSPRSSPTSFSIKESPIQSPEEPSPPPLPKSSPPIKNTFSFNPPQLQQSPEIKLTLSPSLSNKTTPIKTQSPSSTSANTPLRTTPESSPPSSPKVISLMHTISPPQSPKEPEHPKVIEGLQMIQRTEVILRVNATTSDASSQTDKEELPPTPLPTRRKLQEEIECEKLSEDFVKQLPAADRLKGLLVPGPEHKKLTDYVTGLFRVDVTMKPRPANSPFRSRNNTPSSSPPPVHSTNSTTYITTKSSDLTSVVQSIEPTSPLSATSPYFTTSEPKAKFLTRYSQDMNQYTIKNTKDLNQKKDELVNRLDRKLEVLRSEQLVVSEECRINNELGQNVESHLAHVARPHETSKFRLHIEEIGKITSLLLSLSGRLARVENALMGMAEDHPERRILESKRDKLLEQLDEAKKLKESIDRRSVSVSNILYKYLSSEEYADYDHFINMKAKLIMDSKEIADKIKLGEEQLMALKETLIVTD